MKKTKALDKYLKECINEEIFPGSSYALVKRNNITINHLGYSQIMPKKVPIGSSPIYDLASLTKVIVTVSGILSLIEDGKINLNTKVIEILPRFNHAEITVLHLLTHTSGLPSLRRFYKTSKSIDNFWDEIYTLELEYRPGTKVVYSDFGYVFLGEIINEITGSLEEYIENKIFAPLDMNSTTFNPKGILKQNCVPTEIKKDRGLIKGEVHDGNAYYMGGTSGHAGLFSTVEDLSKYVSMVLNNGVYNDKRILSIASVNLLKANFTKDLNENRSLGWLINKDYKFCNLASNKAIYHTGFTGTSIIIDRDFAFIFLTNKVHLTRENKKFVEHRFNINNLAFKTMMEDR